MSPPGKQHFGVLVVALLVGAAMVMAVTASGMPASLASTETFTDPAGDSQGGPDVTTVAIDGDAATETIKVAVTATGYLPASPDAFERNVIVWLDTDKDGDTGHPADGTDYGLITWNDATGQSWDVSHWNGSEWESVPQSSTMSFTRSGDVLTWTVNASDLGGATSFAFYVHACTWDPAAEEHIALDMAPDGYSDWWEFDLSPPPPIKVTLKISPPTTTPKRAVAGKRFTVDFSVVFEKEKPFTIDGKPGWMLLWEPVSGGKMVCDPSVAGKVIAHSESLKSGKARLSFVIPKAAKGKLLKVKVKITATDRETGKTLTATKIASFRVK